MNDLRRLAAYKYDSYEGFGPGERFFESLARWISQFTTHEQRRRLISFVRRELVFVSREELNQIIACVYPDFVKPYLVRSVAHDLSIPRYHVNDIVDSVQFRTLRRKTLYLGLSDGARVDRLRRSSPELSHEQFWLSPELGSEAVRNMREKLANALEEHELTGGPSFRRVVFLDDFYGSGTSLLSQTDTGSWDGKLRRARDHLTTLQDGITPLISPGAEVMIIVYIASAQAEQHIRRLLKAFRPTWNLTVVQQLPARLSQLTPELRALCHWFFDDVLVDKHKKVPTPLGYKEAALPLVLYHNTPNNSLSPLWADSTDHPHGNRRHALFRRYERHHVDRP